MGTRKHCRQITVVERKENMFLLLRVVSLSKGFCDYHAELAIWAKESENDTRMAGDGLC